jgi:hypothetical protein
MTTRRKPWDVIATLDQEFPNEGFPRLSYLDRSEVFDQPQIFPLLKIRLGQIPSLKKEFQTKLEHAIHLYNDSLSLRRWLPLFSEHVLENTWEILFFTAIKFDSFECFRILLLTCPFFFPFQQFLPKIITHNAEFCLKILMEEFHWNIPPSETLLKDIFKSDQNPIFRLLLPILPQPFSQLLKMAIPNSNCWKLVKFKMGEKLNFQLKNGHNVASILTKIVREGIPEELKQLLFHTPVRSLPNGQLVYDDHNSSERICVKLLFTERKCGRTA